MQESIRLKNQQLQLTLRKDTEAYKVDLPF